MFIITYTSIQPNFLMLVLMIQKKKAKHNCNFHYAAMSMVTSQILKIMDFTKTQKSRYLENETLFFLYIQKNH